MKAGTTKKELLAALEAAVKLTQQGDTEVKGLELYDDTTVEITYKNGYVKEVNIGRNSGMAILRDVLNRV